MLRGRRARGNLGVENHVAGLSGAFGCVRWGWYRGAGARATISQDEELAPAIRSTLNTLPQSQHPNAGEAQGEGKGASVIN